MNLEWITLEDYHLNNDIFENWADFSIFFWLWRVFKILIHLLRKKYVLYI